LPWSPVAWFPNWVSYMYKYIRVPLLWDQDSLMGRWKSSAFKLYDQVAFVCSLGWGLPFNVLYGRVPVCSPPCVIFCVGVIVSQFHSYLHTLFLYLVSEFVNKFGHFQSNHVLHFISSRHTTSSGTYTANINATYAFMYKLFMWCYGPFLLS